MINFLVKNTTYLVWILLLIPVAYIHYSHTDSIIDPTSSHTRSHATNQEFSAITERKEEDMADIFMGEDNASLHIGTVDDSGHASESDNGTQSTESEGSFQWGVPKQRWNGRYTGRPSPLNWVKLQFVPP